MKNRGDEVATEVDSLHEIHRMRVKGVAITITSGVDAGARAAVSPAGLVIGTGVGCDLRLNDQLVSRRHVELRPEATGLRVLDLGSRNGTHFGGARIVDILLTEDATLRVGGTEISLSFLETPVDVGVSPHTQFGAAIAHSQAMRHVFELLERAARSDVTVLLEGESGTGKDVLAQALHSSSARSDEPFVVLDCGAMAEGLLEAELFGHEKGAFTGAVGARPGAFEQAHRGTLFLDEVGELPLEAQPKLLRALENRSFRRIGGRQTVNVDVRIVAATNRRLSDAVRRGEFREDLFYRLAVVHVSVPRLADRKEDIAPLAETFLRRATRQESAQVPPDLLKLLVAYDWPGNARELRNVIDRFATFERADAQTLFGNRSHAVAPDSRRVIDLSPLDSLPYHDAKRRLVEAFHRVILPSAVEREGGSIPAAAERLGIPRTSLYRMLQELRGREQDDAIADSTSKPPRP